MPNFLKLVFLLVCPWGVWAQTSRFDTLLPQTARYVPSFWLNVQNAAALADWPQPQYGSTQLSVNQTGGALHRPQEPTVRQNAFLNTEGLRKIGKWTYWGQFGYQKTHDRSLAYSHGYDPFDGNPFVWADTLAGDWQRDHIQAQIAAGTPIGSGRWKAGLTLNYHVGQGARSRDPKPFYRLRDLELRPSLVWRVSDRASWGMVAYIGLKQEENEVGYYSDVFPLLYRLRGYGTFSRTPTVSAERRIAGKVYRLTVQYQHFTKNNSSWLAQIGGGVRQEKIREGVAVPTNGGQFSEHTVEAFLSWTKPNQQRNWLGEFRLLNQNGRGRDPIINANSVNYNWLTANAKYGFWQQEERRFQHIFLRSNFKLINQSDQISRTDLNVNTLLLTADWLERYSVRKTWLWYGLEAGYRARLSGAFVANRPTPLTATLMRPDFAILSTNALIMNASAGVDWQFERFPNLWHRLGFSGQFQRNNTLGSRQLAQINYTILY